MALNLGMACDGIGVGSVYQRDTLTMNETSNFEEMF